MEVSEVGQVEKKLVQYINRIEDII